MPDALAADAPFCATSVCTSLADALREERGLAHKRDIETVAKRLGLPVEDMQGAVMLGDDCAAIPDGDGYLLFAIEGFLPGFVAAEPWFAGWCGVMVNVSDVYAMGGRPLAVVDALWSAGEAQAAPLLDGMAAASRAYGVPVVGGHSNMRAAEAQLSVAVLGRATRLLTSFAARPGELLLAAIDLRGSFRPHFDNFDAASAAEPAQLRHALALLPRLAEAGLARAAKDISQAGLVGTALMLAETSGIGLVIDPLRVPRPEGVALLRWLRCFPSFGFLITARPQDADAIIALFGDQGVACAAVGDCEAGSSIHLIEDGHETLFWDHAVEPLTGCGSARQGR